ncbi:hypothetical protein WJX74_008234 [Apatococcus lobatus]|uniref:Protein ENHANCED DISEASE RESISTANCE 2 C-terminal domain-containing protein n=1 Tax=Apatococcus lobatus TaxID=904363 RepID=A0AAW1SEK1_9CHLO
MRRVKKVGQTVVHPVRGVRQALQHRSSKQTHSSVASESGSSEEAGGSRTALSHDGASLQSPQMSLEIPQMSLEYPQDSLDTPQQSGSLGDIYAPPLTGFHDAVAQIHREGSTSTPAGTPGPSDTRSPLPGDPRSPTNIESRSASHHQARPSPQYQRSNSEPKPPSQRNNGVPSDQAGDVHQLRHADSGARLMEDPSSPAAFHQPSSSFQRDSSGPATLPSSLVQGGLALEASHRQAEATRQQLQASSGTWVSPPPHSELRLGRLETRRGGPGQDPPPLAFTSHQSTAATQEAQGFAARQRTEQAPLPSDQWASCRHINGVSIFEEKVGPEGQGGAFMVSSVIRAAPRDALKVLIDHGRYVSSLPQVSINTQETPSSDERTTSFEVTLQPEGFWGRLCAPRVCHLQQTVSETDDGTLLVLFSEQDWPASSQPPPPPWWNWFAPVSGSVYGGGWTISPMRPELQTEGHVAECLVTLVIRADLNGWLGTGHSDSWGPARWVATCIRNAFIEPLLMSIISVRELVEHDKFVVRPFCMTHENIVAPAPNASHDIASPATTPGRPWPSTPVQHYQEAGPARTYAASSEFAQSRPSAHYNQHEAGPHSSQPGWQGPGQTAQQHEADVASEQQGEARFQQGIHERNEGGARGAESGGAAPQRQDGGAGGAAMGLPHSDQQPPAHPPHGSASGHLSCLQPCRSAEANGQRGAGSAGMLGQLDKEYWSCPGDSGLRIRGAHYLQDKKKIPAAGPVFSLVAADLIETPRPMTHIAQHLPSLRHSSAGFSFVWQVMIPGPPYLSLISTWAVDVPEGQRSDGLLDTSHLTSTPFDRCLARFLDGTDKDRNSMFKLIPNVAKGSWVIKQSVGHSPVLLGNKLKTHYFRTDRYMEVDVDVASSSAANTVVKLVQGATRHLVVDMAILLEGHTEDELPEVLLGTIRYSQLDMRKSQRLDLDEQVVSSSAG